MASPLNLLFDLDGTIADSRPGIVNCYRRTFTELGLPEPADYNVYLGPPLHQIMRGLVGEARAADAVALFRRHYGETGMYECEAFAGIPELLKAVDAKLFVATSKAHAYARKMLEHMKLDGHFVAIHGAELDGTRADKGELIAHVLKSEGLDARACLMIGDREHDAIGARKNGVPCLGVAWGYASPGELEAAGVIGIVSHPREISAFLPRSR